MTARRLAVIILAPLVLLSLGTCGLFFASPFPLDMAQAMAVRDFSASIPDGVSDDFRPWVIEPDDSTRLILLIGGFHPSGPHDPWLFVLDESLAPVQTPLTRAALDAITNDPGSGHPWGFSGKSVFIDSQGYVVVGNAMFTVSDRKLIPAVPTPANTDAYHGDSEWAFPEFSAPFSNFALMGVDDVSHELEWNDYMSDWSAPQFRSLPVRSSGPPLHLQRVLAAPPWTGAAKTVLLFEEEWNEQTDSRRSYFVRVPRTEFHGFLQSNFLDETDFMVASYPRFTLQDADSRRAGIVEFDDAPAVVAFAWETGDWTMTSMESGKEIRRLHVGRIDDGEEIQSSWSYKGGYSVVYDRTTHLLTKVAKWWD